MPHESPVPGGRRMECLTVVLPHQCPCGQATTAYSLRSGHEVCRIGTSPAAYFLSPSSMLRRQSCQSHQSRQSPIIHARRASNVSSISSISSVSSVPHNPCQTRFQWPRAAPVPCARLALQSPQADAARGAAPPPPLERLRVRATSRSVSSARLHDRFRQFTLGFVSSSTRSPDSGLTHAPQLFSLRSKRCHAPQSLFFSSVRLA